MKIAVLLLAAGRGTRFGGALAKQYVKVCGQEILLHTLQSLSQEPRITIVQPVIAEGDMLFSNTVSGHSFPFQLLPAIYGGAERAISMQKGLAALPDDIDMVAVHDAARPLTSKHVLMDVLDMAEMHGAAIPGFAVNDTIKRISEDGRVIDTPNRTYLRAVQTPQVARRAWFEQALKQECKRLHLHTDDASVLEAAGFAVYVSQGDVNNRKITTKGDLLWMQTQLTQIEKTLTEGML
ncbi:MAG: 2-C-methyl-D-erythritol 4-phosphate cytidylyltransferase [Mariprofundaceae bacterium]|nr:2-C-methyl-D-erythritol 4-phosphate cytidylyltransferase [Mariprofundaceae bacterium]